MDIILAAFTCAFLISLVAIENPYLKAGVTWTTCAVILELLGDQTTFFTVLSTTRWFTAACTAAFVANVLLLVVSRLATLKFGELTRRRY